MSALEKHAKWHKSLKGPKGKKKLKDKLKAIKKAFKEYAEKSKA